VAILTSVDHLPVDFSKFDLDSGMTVTTGPFGRLSASQSTMYAQWDKSFIGIYQNALTVKGSWIFGPSTVFGIEISPWVAIDSGTVNSFEYFGAIASGSAISTHFTITGFEVPAKNMAKYFANPALYIFAGDDTISGSNVGDVLFGYDGNDKIYGRGGADILMGGAGSDLLDGGDGLDTAVYAGSKASYALNRTANGWTVQDLRTGSPDGTDTLTNVERIAFSDGVVWLDGGSANATTSVTVAIHPDLSGNFVDFDPASPYPAATARTESSFTFDFGLKNGMSVKDTYGGIGFTYDAAGNPTGGTITSISHYNHGGAEVVYSDILLSVSDVVGYFRTGDSQGLQKLIMAGNDQVIGGGGWDKLHGYAGNDTIKGNAGNDIIYGDEGDDVIDGGGGTDTAAYDAPIANFQFTGGAKLGVWSWVVRDTRANGLGVDSLTDIENLQFSDKTVDLSKYDSSLTIATLNILRISSVTEIDVMIGNGLMAKSAGMAALIARADATTSVATMAYQFFTGKIPTSGGIDYLVSPTGANANNLNSAYYQSFNLENRYINFAVNLGKNGEGKTAFTAKYGSLSLFDATREAYKTIFGGTPTDAKVHALIDSRVDYFASYGGDGSSGIGTKAAMVGWLLSEAAKADIGMYSKANNAFLADLADGASFAIDLVGVYGKAEYNYAG